MEDGKTKNRLTFWYLILWILLFVALYLSYGVYFVDLTTTKSKWVILFSSAIAILFGTCKFLEISFYKPKDENIKNIFKDENNLNFSFGMYKNLMFIFFLLILFLIFFSKISLLPSFCFLSGVIAFMFSSVISSVVMIIGKVKAEDAFLKNLNLYLKLNFNTTCVCTFLFWGVLCSGMIVLFHHFKDYELLITYVCGYCTASFFENLVCCISKGSFMNLCGFLKRNNFPPEKQLPVNNMMSIISNYNYCVFFETFAIALVFAISTGINSTGLMGGFLPLVIGANAMFVSIIVFLFSKNNKSNNISKHFFRKVIFIALITSLMVFVQIYYWLGKDFLPIGFSALFGSFASVATLLYKGNNKIKTEIHKFKNYFSKTAYALFVVLALFASVFLVADGMNYVHFAFYNLTIAVLSYNAVVGIVSVASREESLKDRIQNYLKTSNIILLISLVICFCIVLELEDADILNPLIAISFLLGAFVAFAILYFASGRIIRQTKSLTIAVKKQIREKFTDKKKVMIKSAFHSVVCSAVAFSIFTGSMFAIKKYLSSDVLLGFVFGICVCLIALLYTKDEVLGSISASLVRFSLIFALSVGFLF